MIGLIAIVFFCIIIAYKLRGYTLPEDKPKTFNDSSLVSDHELKELLKKEIKRESLDIIINKIHLVEQVDDFEDTVTVHFLHIDREEQQYLPMYPNNETDPQLCYEHMGLSFSIFKGLICLDVYSNMPDLGVAKGDRLILIFENGHRVEYTFNLGRISGYPKSNFVSIDLEELEIFCTQKLDKWKLISTRRNLYAIGDNSIHGHLSKMSKRSDTQEILIYLAKTIKEFYLKSNTNQGIVIDVTEIN